MHRNDWIKSAEDVLKEGSFFSLIYAIQYYNIV